MFDFIWTWPIFIMHLAWVFLFWGLVLGGLYLLGGIAMEKIDKVFLKRTHNDLNKPEDWN